MSVYTRTPQSIKDTWMLKINRQRTTTDFGASAATASLDLKKVEAGLTVFFLSF